MVIFSFFVSPALAAGYQEENVNYWLYLSIPVVSAIVGWGTNVVALKMTFFPIEFFGIPIKTWPEQPFGLIGENSLPFFLVFFFFLSVFTTTYNST